MLKNAQYLPLSKRTGECIQCQKSLLGEDRHPSVLLDPEEAEKWNALQLENQAQDTGENPEPLSEEPSQDQTQEIPPEETPSESPEPAAQNAEAAEEEKKPQGKKKTDEKPQDDGKSPPSGFLRLDFCPNCWQEFENTEFFSYWMGRRTESDLPPKKLNREERNLALLALFDSLSDQEDEENDFTPHRFFLAHLLMKFKIFKWQPSISDPETGAPLLRFLRTDAEEEVQIPEIEMPTEAIVKIKEEIEGYLQQSTGQVIRL